MEVGRNAPCPCGSGKKYKRCHGAVSAAPTSADAAAPSVVPSTAVHQVIDLVNKGRLEEADKRLRGMLSRQPSDPEIAYYAGVVAFQLGRAEQSLELLRSAVSLDPKYTDAFHALGTIFLELRRLEEAAQAFESVLGLMPDRFDVLVSLGSIQAELGAIKKGAALLKRALAIDGSRPDLNNNLGVIYQGLGGFAEAESYLSAAAAAEPQNFDYRANMARNQYSLGNYGRALEEYRAAIELDATVLSVWQSLVDCLSMAEEVPVDDRLRSDLLACFAMDELDVTGLGHLIVQFIKRDLGAGEITAIADEYSASDGDRQKAVTFLRNMSDPLITRFLRRSRVQDVEGEGILTALRKIFLVSAREKRLSELLGSDGNGEDLLYALAHHCYFSEYVLWVSDQEGDQLRQVEGGIAQDLKSKDGLDPLNAALTACYTPLPDSGFQMELTAIDGTEYGDAFEALFRQHVLAPRLEAALSRDIPNLSVIEDDVSQRVRSQYEENPYPRWDYLRRWEIASFSNTMLKRFPHLSHQDIRWPAAPSYLVAGCGTGRLPISIAQSVSNVEVLAVDLSLNSLAYAARKTQELGVSNIRFAQADILDLKRLEDSFDVIDCSGVLHHMRDPMEGWKSLNDRLAPGGFMRIGLYSELARRYMIQVQRFARDEGYGSTADDIRRCRRDIMMLPADDPMRNVVLYPDFYALSECRDMLFHVQEHRFTIPEISQAIDQLGLELVGFDFPDSTTINAYKCEFPDDVYATSLDNWHDFELADPDVFFGMYNFWLRKTG